jgi:hypothetical protein
MEMLFNTSSKYILVKDMTDLLDFDAINKEFETLAWKENIANKVSIEMDLFDRESLVNLKSIIIEDCKQYLNHTANMEPHYDDLVMTRSWANITEPGQGHHDHVHPFSIVSGAIFLDNNPSNLNLYIESFMPEIPYFITKSKAYVSLKSLLNDMGAKPSEHNYLKNHMVLFLSNSSHFVENIPMEVPARKSISFNTFWKGLVGVRGEALGSHVF